MRDLVVDAAYAHGIAAIAMAGDLGEQTRILACISSVEAELEAILLGLGALGSARVRIAAVHTDCQAAANWWRTRSPTADTIRRQLADRSGWRIVHAERDIVARAHDLAHGALRRAAPDEIAARRAVRQLQRDVPQHAAPRRRRAWDGV